MRQMYFGVAEMQYLGMLRDIFTYGHNCRTRNGMAQKLFGLQLRAELSKGFPILTTREIDFGKVKREVLGCIKRSDNNRKLKRVIDQIRRNPHDRQLVVTTWNFVQINQIPLPPCHPSFQFFVFGDELSVHVNQQSCEMFWGVPIDLASYALLLSMMAEACGLRRGECVITFNDTHIYHAHMEEVKEQLSREPYATPKLRLSSVDDIDSFTEDDIELIDYYPRPRIEVLPQVADAI